MTAAPGCVWDGALLSSVSSEWARMALASAASMGPQATLEATTVATGSPP